MELKKIAQVSSTPANSYTLNSNSAKMYIMIMSFITEL